MIIRNRKNWEISENEVTSKSAYLSRREFMAKAGGAASVALLGNGLWSANAEAAPLNFEESGYQIDEELTPIEAVTGYNNYYEFGTSKDDPARYGSMLTTDPWAIEVAGEVASPGTFALEDFIKPHTLEERIYRMRCVEAWSMVIPWIGIPLVDVIRRLEPTSRAKYVRFETLVRPLEMPGIRRGVIDYPYVEGLRMDEAMNPLTLLAVGLYGETLLPQNGAPIRLVTPWKYGFKGVKSIVKIEFQESQPMNTWQLSNPREYGFYANVNPRVDHPRWSQATERRIGEFFRRDTLMFNGYADEVAEMYAGMDLAKEF